MEKCFGHTHTESFLGKEFYWPAPNICHPYPFRLVEKLIVRKYIMPALPLDLISDQFAYRPTGSTTAALVSLTHTVAQKLETCSYVRCLLIDYTKAFDMINHSILFRKIRSLTIPSEIQRWMFHFFTGRKQAVWTVAVASYYTQYCSGLRFRTLCLCCLRCRS